MVVAVDVVFVRDVKRFVAVTVVADVDPLTASRTTWSVLIAHAPVNVPMRKIFCCGY
jgi:hypothetical protein